MVFLFHNFDKLISSMWSWADCSHIVWHTCLTVVHQLRLQWAQPIKFYLWCSLFHSTAFARHYKIKWRRYLSLAHAGRSQKALKLLTLPLFHTIVFVYICSRRLSDALSCLITSKSLYGFPNICMYAWTCVSVYYLVHTHTHIAADKQTFLVKLYKCLYVHKYIQ